MSAYMAAALVSHSFIVAIASIVTSEGCLIPAAPVSVVSWVSYIMRKVSSFPGRYTNPGLTFLRQEISKTDLAEQTYGKPVFQLNFIFQVARPGILSASIVE
ncbi:hypothetical protein GGS21DRAFT_464081 [Xylaria nigripes]|nr:hypothetical protein GGS21DRAFT_464081 [Xylaria nigripes]